MSDLNALIKTWRSGLSELSTEELDELEDHIRTETEGLIRTGLSEREAFTVAVMRCGKSNVLEYEITRGNPAGAWSRRLRWMIVGAITSSLSSLAFGGMTSIAGALMITHGVPLPWMIALRFVSLSVLIFVVVLAFHLWLGRRSSAALGEPPSWLTSGWSLALMVGLMPWIVGSMQIAMSAGSVHLLTLQQSGQLALSDSVIHLVSPFVAPLILLIIAVSLSKHREQSVA